MSIAFLSVSFLTCKMAVMLLLLLIITMTSQGFCEFLEGITKMILRTGA